MRRRPQRMAKDNLMTQGRIQRGFEGAGVGLDVQSNSIWLDTLFSWENLDKFDKFVLPFLP